uniref:RING-type domain-containing protein n=1 Tax=Macrostomum lignano TaxID=282301 RepID=A0A1I8GZW5_9PLAT
ACLEAFERFSGRKSCPMCRKEAYEKRLIYDGEYQHLVRCATRILHWPPMHPVVKRGALNPGHLARLRCPPALQAAAPAAAATDPRLRRRFYEERLAEVSDRMVRCCDLGVNDFLADIDRCVAASRRVFQAWPGARRDLSEEQWGDTAGKAIRRCDADCPICLLPLAVPASAVGAAAAASALARPAVLLSCSHVFHAVCIATFEELVCDAPARLCPVCRAPGYQKRPIDPSILLPG